MEKILRAAEQVFAEKGFQGSRTRDIAARAGVNVSTLHYHYRSKEDLYAAVLRVVFGEVQEKIVAAGNPEAAGPESHLRRFIEAHFDAIAARPHFPRLMYDALVHAPAAIRSVARDTIRPIVESLVPYLALGAQTGALRAGIDLRHAVLSAAGMNSIYFVAAPLAMEFFGAQALGPAALHERKEAVIDLLLHGLLARPEAPRPRQEARS